MARFKVNRRQGIKGIQKLAPASSFNVSSCKDTQLRPVQFDGRRAGYVLYESFNICAKMLIATYTEDMRKGKPLTFIRGIGGIFVVTEDSYLQAGSTVKSSRGTWSSGVR